MGYLFAYVLYGLLIAPVVIRIDAVVEKTAGFAVTINVWGISAVLHLNVTRDDDGNMVLRFYRNGSIKRHEREAGTALRSVRPIFYALLNADKTRKWIGAKFNILRLRGVMRVSLLDASKTALVSAAIEEVLRHISRMLSGRNISHALRVWPDFSQKGSACQGSCILFVRMGNLVVLGSLIGVLAKRAAKKQAQIKEAQKWNTPLKT